MTREAAKKIVWIISFIVLVLLVVFASLFAYQRAYAGKIYRNVYITDTDLSGMTKKQAKILLDKKFREILTNRIVFKAKDKEISINLADTGLNFDTGAMTLDSYRVGRDGNFYGRLTKSALTLWQKKTVEATPVLDQKRYDEFINLTIPQLNISAQDATLAIKEGQVVQTTESAGQKVKTGNLTDKLMAAVESGQTSVNLDVEEIRPNLSASDFSAAKTYAEKILAKKIALQYESYAFTPDQEELGNWIVFSNSGSALTAGLDDDQIRSYLTQIATNFEIQKVNKKINAADNSVIVEGKAGKYLDKDAAVKAIKAQIDSDVITVSLATNNIEPEEEKIFPAEGIIPGRFPGKYIDIDLAQQKLCKVESNNIGDCFIISSGKPSMPTPTGTYAINVKNPRQWSGKYGLWMPWWQSFKGDYGLHELPEWPSGYKEGEAHLGTPVSHGCVRLGVGSAENLYNWTEIGTPIYIHR